MSDHPFDELAALRDLIPATLDSEALSLWRRTGAAALIEQGLYPETELQGDSVGDDLTRLEHLDARAEAELVAAILVAAANHARRSS